MAKIAVIGSGFAGLSSACFLAKAGHSVTVFEKNATIGGRARVLKEKGFTFDMGPSWYWMPDVFDRFFNSFGKKTSDYYELIQLDPGFQMMFGNDDTVRLPAAVNDVYKMVEGIEVGAAANMAKFLLQAEVKYKIGMGIMVYKPSASWSEFARVDIMVNAPKLQLLTPVSTHVRKYFKDKRLIALMEFPVLFLGAMADRIPAMYTMMNYAAISLGTWYPTGGMARIVNAMETLALSLGVKFKTSTEVTSVNIESKRAVSVSAGGDVYKVDGVVGAGDYHHIEQKLLQPQYRNYDQEYWDKRTFAPSALIFYIGVSKRIKKLLHHNLAFDAAIDLHSKEIYDNPVWPSEPLFYVCCPSKTDAGVAPQGMENLFILMPVATGLTDTEAIRERYFDIIIKRLEALCGDDIAGHIIYKKSYCINDFVADYHACRGNAYGLANTLAQTAVLKPALRNKKVSNLFYAGQLTVPGPGVPPALVSGQLAAEQLIKTLKPVHEAVV
ncbi:MAG: phytoene desaturase [Taibaiella sp.]|nr:phytoene desaturase [Taibaiella sp.]